MVPGVGHVNAAVGIGCQVELQRRSGGNAMIGRQVYPLLAAAGLNDVRVSPRMIYVDSSRSHLVDGFTRKTFTAMIEGVREEAINAGIIDAERFDAGIRACTEPLKMTVFSATRFSKAWGRSRRMRRCKMFDRD